MAEIPTLKPGDDAYKHISLVSHWPWYHKYQKHHLQDGSSRLLARSIYLKQNDKWKKDRSMDRNIQNLGRIWPQISLCFLIVCI